MLKNTQAVPPRVHSIERLAELATVRKDLPTDVLVLDDFYVSTRYPDASVGLPFEMIGREEAEMALGIATTSLDVVRRRLLGDEQR